jgi:serine/threonine-protein kinase
MVAPNESKTTTITLSGFLDGIKSANILSERQRATLDAKLAEAGHPTDPDELAAVLVNEGVVTDYQAKQVLRGKPQSLTFGGYVILDFLGKGTMGKVYKAQHRMMGRIVALKILEPRYINSTRSLARFQREMQMVGRLDHPNVVRAFDADKVGDAYFIAMEFADGYTLEDLLKARGALPAPDVVYYASQAADGLAHAHAKGIVHRDIKPSNLMLTQGKKLKVLDFGLGTLLEGEDQSSALTTAGMAVGTPDYISPEQARMIKLDGRSDLYSLGCTMYHLLSGKLPFQGESSMDCIVGRITGQAIPIRDVMPGLPPRVVESIEKLMAPNPDDRYQTAEEAANALRSLLRPKNPSTSRSASTVAAPGGAPASAPARPAPARPAAAAAASPAWPVNSHPTRPAPAVTAPEPAVIDMVIPEAPSLPPRAGIAAAKSKKEPPGKRLMAAGSKTKGLIVGVAAAAVALIAGVALMLMRSSTDDRPASDPSASQTNNAPIPPTDGADTRQASAAAESPKPADAAGAQTDATTNATATPVAPPAPPPKPGFVIESPKAGATVGMKEMITGRMESEGWPVIFIQADIPGQPWWCQAPVEQVDGGTFTANVVFGDERTPSGMKFRIAGIVTKTREEALKFTMGSQQQSLPEGFPKSAEVMVTHR